MSQTRISRVHSFMVALSFATSLASASASAADVDAGQAKVTQLCAECHRSRDWSGETTAALESLIADIVAGKVKHSQRKLQLTPQEIADVAAYWTSGRK